MPSPSARPLLLLLLTILIVATCGQHAQLNLVESDSVWIGEGTSILQLVHTTMIECTDHSNCPTCWVAKYSPVIDSETPQSQIPAHVGVIFHDYSTNPTSFYERPSAENQYVILTPLITVAMRPESNFAIEVQIFINFPQTYNQQLSYSGTTKIYPVPGCGTNPPDATEAISVTHNVESPSEMKRNEVSTYFFNRYIPGLPYGDTSPPAGLDPRKNHAEIQAAAWYNWELKPPPQPNDVDYPNLIDFRLYGGSYFVLNETYTTYHEPGATICWINSVPVLVEIDLRTNQTIYVHTNPRLDLHNPESAMSQPIPLAGSNMDAFTSRFFMEFTCQDRLIVVYNPETVRRDVLVYVVGHEDPTTKARTYRKERFPQSLDQITQNVHGPTPVEVLGRAFYDVHHNIFICRTTIDFHSTTWLDDTKNNLNIVVGMDGITYTPDADNEAPHSSALLSILPDTSQYLDINTNDPHRDPNALAPILFVSDVSSTGVYGPFISFKLPSIRPYHEDVKTTPSSRIQINIMFNVREPVFHSPAPSCSIIMHNLRSGDSKLSYSTSQYMNATSSYESEKNQVLLQQRLQQHHHPQQPQSLAAHLHNNDIPANKLYPLNKNNNKTISSSQQQEQQQQPLLATLATQIKTLMSPLNNWFQTTLDHYSQIEFTASPSNFTPKPSTQSQLQPIQTQGWKYPSSFESNTSITVTSRPFNNFSLKINNPHHLDFDYVAINGLPGLTRLSFNSGVKNIIYPDTYDLAEDGVDTAFNVLKKSDNRPELSTNGEQYIIPCRYAHDNTLKLRGALSIYAREFQIGPINHDLIQKKEQIEIICDGVGLVSETVGATTIGDYAYDTETILDPNYPLDKTFSELQLEQWEHFITLYSIIQTDKININNKKLQTHALGLESESIMTIQQQPIESQIYLDRFAAFSMGQPVRTYKTIIAGVIGASVALTICLLAILPIKRRCETKKDEKRHAAVKVEIGGVSNVPFEELGDDDDVDDDDGSYNNYVYH